MTGFKLGQKVRLRPITGVVDDTYEPGATLACVDFGCDRHNVMTGGSGSESRWHFPTWLLEPDEDSNDEASG